MSELSGDIPFDVAKHLGVTEELGEVDVEDVTGMFDHDVVIMTVTDAKNVRCHTVASTACREVVYRLDMRQHEHSAGGGCSSSSSSSRSSSS